MPTAFRVTMASLTTYVPPPSFAVLDTAFRKGGLCLASVHVLGRAPLEQGLRWEQVCSMLGKRCEETFGQEWGGGAESQSTAGQEDWGFTGELRETR